MNLTEHITQLHAPSRTCIIGIDGLGGAGKSTIADALCQRLKCKGYPVTLLHIDDFIHPKAVRYNEQYAAWECYYHLQWRYDYLLNVVIAPLKQGLPLKTDIELYDKEHDRYHISKTDIPIGSIVIVEGIFLQRSELHGVFDYTIYIDIPEEVRLRRVLERDSYIGNREQIREKYAQRYFPAERHYLAACAPQENADFLITEDMFVSVMENQ